MSRFLRRFLSNFILSREKRRAFRMGWGRTRNRGKNNWIILTETDGTEKILSGRAVIPGLDLTFDGDGNVLRLQKPFVFDGCEMLLSGGSRLK